MDRLETGIARLAALIIAGGVVITTIYKGYKALIALSKMKETFDEIAKFAQELPLIKASITDLATKVDELTLTDLRQAVMNDKLPLSERVKAGNKYIELGGNGDVAQCYEVLCEHYRKGLDSAFVGAVDG